MNRYCVDRWDKNKDRLQKRIENSIDHNSWGYETLVKLIIEEVLNPGAEFRSDTWNSEEITVIDNGDYQGSQLFLFHKNTYQPGPADYMITFEFYGSCSGCDTLMAIQEWSYKQELPTEIQVRDYMALCLNLIQQMRFPYWEQGWFDEQDERREIGL